MIHLARNTFVPGVWAGGTTDAIWAAPAAALGSPSAADCWMGLALIARDAPYSFFAGRRRLHLPIRGAGVRLAFSAPDEEVRLTSGESYVFDGERPLLATLLDGPVVAFNLIFRPDIAAAATLASIGPAPQAWPAPPPGRGDGARQAVRIALCTAGAMTVSHGAATAPLADGDALVISPGERGDAPEVALARDGEAPAEAVLATIWLPAGGDRR